MISLILKIIAEFTHVVESFLTEKALGLQILLMRDSGTGVFLLTLQNP